MSEQRKKLAVEAAALARMIATLEQTVAEVKANYWAKVAELHTVEEAEGEGETLAEMAERYKAGANDSFTVAKGAITSDDT